MPAVVTSSAGNVMEHHDPVSGLKFRNSLPYGGYDTRCLVTKNSWRRVRAGRDLLQVRSAHAAGVHAQQDLALLNLRHGNGLETNIVLADVSGTGIAPEDLVSLLEEAGLRVLERDTSRIRLVTHRLIGDEDVERAVAIVAETVERHAVPPLELPEIDDSWEAELDDLPED